jgi:hypothetical protein
MLKAGLLFIAYSSSALGDPRADLNRRPELLFKALMVDSRALALELSTDCSLGPCLSENTFNGAIGVVTSLLCISLDSVASAADILSTHALGARAIFASKSEGAACYLAHGDWLQLEVPLLNFILRSCMRVGVGNK